jgi:3-isopropylmalate/(R)-2-methylmalate dehydratase small subunit
VKALRTVTGKVAVLDRADVDTDQIIPKQFLKRIERSGYGQYLFYDWVRDPAFFLNDPENRDAPILIAGRNFGCGSSREHAAWALEDFGFRVVIAPSFGDIFWQNAVNTGLAPIALGPDAIAELREALAGGNEMTVDLEHLRFTHPGGLELDFAFDAHAQETLVNGLDDVARTLQRADEIGTFEAGHTARFDVRELALT